MPSYINTNMMSLTAQRNLSTSQASMATAMQRLSSGLRINSAKDDAAGLAISSRMTSQINGMQQAGRNANDAISLAQTAEGSLQQIGSMLQSMRTLAVQAANASNSDSDRASIQQNLSQLRDEIQRVATTSQFNGINLLDGTFTAQAFQVGANANQTVSVSLDSAQTSKLGSTLAASLTASNNGTAMSGGDLTINGVSIRGSAATDDASSSTGQSASAIAKVAAINASSAQTGVVATVNTNIQVGAAQTLGAGSGTITINGITTGTIVVGGQNGTSDRAAVVNAVNAISGQTGVRATDSGLSTNGITLTAADGRNIAVTLTAAAGSVFTSASTGVSQVTAYGTYTLSSSKAIVVTGTAANLANAGVNAGTFSTQTAYAATTAGSATAFAAGDFTINGIAIGASLTSYDAFSTAGASASAIAKAAAINAISAQTGVLATANTNTSAGAAQTMAAGSVTFTINGVTTATVVTGGTDATADRSAVVNAINAISGRTGVVAVDSGSTTNGISLVAADGRNIAIAATATAGSVFTSASTGVTLANATVYGTFTLSSAKTFTIASGPAPTNTLAADAMLAVGTYGAGKSGQALSTLDVSTAAGANNAIVAVDNAISTINTMEANLGAYQNRFESTVSGLGVTSDNLTAARSRIQDADFAQETASLTRSQILQQAGTAMLAQANQSGQSVLSLLR